MGLKDVTLIDPVFKIPTGAEDDFEYTRDRVDIEAEEAALNEVLGLATPNSFEIISQKIQRGKGNQQRVDIVFETDLIEGATKYEIKVAKA